MLTRDVDVRYNGKAPLLVMFQHARLVKEMALQELAGRYAGTIGGLFWGIVNPIVTLLVYWFVFQFVLHAQGEGSVPFFVIITCAFIPWATFVEMVSTCTTSITSKPFIVAKAIFPSEVLPAVAVTSAVLLHLLLLLAFGALLIAATGLFSIFAVQMFYYLFAMSMFALGLGMLLASLNVLFRDIGQLTTVGLNIWFWLTPVVWTPDAIPQRYHFVITLNPMAYIVEGYRDSFFRGVAFWDKPLEALCFWVFCLSALAVGSSFFSRLKPEFAEML